MNNIIEVSQWFPDTAYYRGHADRFVFSFANLPRLAKGFRCLCIGSWGAEAPYLYEVMGAGEVVAVRAPDEGVPEFEERSISAPCSSRAHEVSIYAADIESTDLTFFARGFDLVLAWEVLEHLCVDPSFMVWQAIRAAKVGGLVSVTTPNPLWHIYTIAQIYGNNALGLRIQHHIPHATHWRLYSPREVSDLFREMGCRINRLTTFLDEKPFGWKSRAAQTVLNALRKNSGNGETTLGKHVWMLAEKQQDAEQYRPTWLHPDTTGSGRLAHLA